MQSWLQRNNYSSKRKDDSDKFSDKYPEHYDGKNDPSTKNIIDLVKKYNKQTLTTIAKAKDWQLQRGTLEDLVKVAGYSLSDLANIKKKCLEDKDILPLLNKPLSLDNLLTLRAKLEERGIVSKPSEIVPTIVPRPITNNQTNQPPVCEPNSLSTDTTHQKASGEINWDEFSLDVFDSKILNTEIEPQTQECNSEASEPRANKRPNFGIWEQLGNDVLSNAGNCPRHLKKRK